MNDAPVSEDISSTTDEDTEKEITSRQQMIEEMIRLTHCQSLLMVQQLYRDLPQYILLLIITTEVTPSPTYANDGTDDSNTATVSITVTAVNDTPVSEDISSTTDEDTEKEITLKATDVEGSDLTYSIVSEPENGTLTQDGKSIVYSPSANYNGSDSFTYKANDGTDDSNTATVTITVTAVNDAPITLPDFYTTQENSPITVFTNVGILSNDYDVEGQEFTIILI